MGEVYRARDTALGRDVAIKVLPGTFAADPDRLARFDREARLLASLNHPNIGAIYGLESLPANWRRVAAAGNHPGVRRWRIAERLHRAVGGVERDHRVRERGADDRSPDCDALDAAHELRHHPSRPQAGEHQADERGRRESAGFRVGQDGWYGRRQPCRHRPRADGHYRAARRQASSWARPRI